MTKKDQDMYRRSALSAYADVDVQAKTSTENPQELITLLFQKACVLMRQSQEQLKRDDDEGFVWHAQVTYCFESNNIFPKSFSVIKS